MKSHWIFLGIVLLYGYNFEPIREDAGSGLCEVLFRMIQEDQKYRGLSGKISDNFPIVLDSLIISKGLMKSEFLGLPENQQSTLRQEALKLTKKKLKPLMTQNDSLRSLQAKIDAKNTKTLLRIVRKNGWPTAKSLGCKEKFNTVFIFRHAPQKYWNEIREIIDKERSAKRLSDYEYYIIDNHIKGRPPLIKKPKDFVD